MSREAWRKGLEGFRHLRFSFELRVCLFLFVCLYACLFVCLYACLFVCVSICLFECLCLSECMFICVHVHLHICMQSYMHIFALFFNLSIRASIPIQHSSPQTATSLRPRPKSDPRAPKSKKQASSTRRERKRRTRLRREWRAREVVSGLVFVAHEQAGRAEGSSPSLLRPR